MTPAGAPTNGSPIRKLTNLGVSLWLDDLSRSRLVSGGLRDLVATRSVSGVTTNPTIFASALTGTDAYDDAIRRLAAERASVEDAAFELMTDDVRAAADVLRPRYESTHGDDGWVSIEVNAATAHDVEATLHEARRLARRIDRPNAFVKIPATTEGLAATTAALAEGISVNVTLIFSLSRYLDVIEAYLAGIDQAAARGRDITRIHSVASFFVSRVDTEVDARLASIGTVPASAIAGKVAIANCCLAYELLHQQFDSERARRLLAMGGNVQRLLWASTGVKDPRMPDTRYVEELAAPGVINTMPEATLRAVEDHAHVRGDAITGSYSSARAVLAALAGLGVSYDDVTATLEREGVAKFARSGEDLLRTVAAALETASSR